MWSGAACRYFHLYRFNLSHKSLALISLFILPPGSALVQSIRSFESTPSILSLVMALTKASSQALLLDANAEKGPEVRGFCETLLSDGRVNGAWSEIVSE